MATSLADDAKQRNWDEPHAALGEDPLLSRRQWLLWGVVSVALLCAFLLFLVDDHVLRNVIAVN